MATTVMGQVELKRKLDRMPVVAKAAIKAAMEKSAEQIADMARRLVPVNTGNLRDSIGWTWGAAPKGSMTLARAVGSALGTDELVLTVFAGNDKAYYSRWVEFGTAATSAQPFFYPAYRSSKKRAVAAIRRGIRQAAKQAVGR